MNAQLKNLLDAAIVPPPSPESLFVGIQSYETRKVSASPEDALFGGRIDCEEEKRGTASTKASAIKAAKDFRSAMDRKEIP